MWYRNSGTWLRELFPNQTKNVPTMLLWAVIYVLYLVLVFWLSDRFGIQLPGMPYKMMSLLIPVYALLAVALFYAQAKAWDWIISKLKK